MNAATSVEEGAKKCERLHKKYDQCFGGGLHNMLWQILVNKATDRFPDEVVFTPVYESNYLMLALARGDGGYSPTSAVFNKATTYDVATDVAMELNSEVFGLNVMASYRIIAKSMRKKVRSAERHINRALDELKDIDRTIDHAPNDTEVDTPMGEAYGGE